MLQDVERRLYEEAAIFRRLDELAREITADYRGVDLTAIAVMNGSLLFAADLLRRVELPLKLECVRASSYHGGTESSGHVEFPEGFLPRVQGRHVLVLDDILDTGRTLHALRQRLEGAGALGIEVCVLLRKRKARAQPVEARYAGFEIGDEFVVGYGLDFRGDYRHLPFIGTLRREVVNAGS